MRSATPSPSRSRTHCLRRSSDDEFDERHGGYDDEETTAGELRHSAAARSATARRSSTATGVATRSRITTASPAAARTRSACASHIELGEGTARTEWVAGDDYVGWEEKVHGGHPRHAARRGDGVGAVQLRLVGGDGRDEHPLSARRRTRASGSPRRARVTSRRRRIYDVSGEVRGAEGRLIAEAEGRFLGARRRRRRELKERYGMPAEHCGEPGAHGERHDIHDS